MRQKIKRRYINDSKSAARNMLIAIYFFFFYYWIYRISIMSWTCLLKCYLRSFESYTIIVDILRMLSILFSNNLFAKTFLSSIIYWSLWQMNKVIFSHSVPTFVKFNFWTTKNDCVVYRKMSQVFVSHTVTMVFYLSYLRNTKWCIIYCVM